MVSVSTARLAGTADVSVESEPEVPKGNVLAWLPFVTDFPRAGSKKIFGSFAGSWACTRPLSSAFFGAVWQKTELRFVGGFVVKS